MPRQLLVMAMRVAAYALLLEAMLHYQFYYNININRLFAGLHPLEVAWAGYFTLNFMYPRPRLRTVVAPAAAAQSRAAPSGTSSSPSSGACSAFGRCVTA